MGTTDAFEADPELDALEVGSKIRSSAEPVNKLITWVRKEKSYAKPHIDKWRKQEKECRRFYDGHHLSDADLKQLEKDLRPSNAFNAAQKFIRFVSGVERFSPDALIFSPIDESNQQQQDFGELVTRAYDWAILKAKGTYKRSVAFEDLLIGGMGWMDYCLDYSVEPNGLIGAARIPPKEMLWPECSTQNLDDTRWRGRECEIDVEEACARWPGEEKKIRASMVLEADRARPEAEGTVKYTVPYIETEPLDEQMISMFKKDKVKILEWEFYENEPGYYFYDPLEKSDAWYSKKDFFAYRKRLRVFKRLEIKDYTPRSQKKFQKVFILNDRYQLGEVLDLPQPHFYKNCMTAHYDDEEKLWYGFFRIFLDPQKFANKFFNQVTEVIGSQSKGGLLMEDDAVEPKHQAEFKETYAIPGTVNFVAPGAISGNKIKDKQLPQLPATALQMVQYCIAAMEDVAGIKPETAFGSGTENVPGVTLKQKQKSGLLLLACEFDAMSIFRISEGEIIFSLLGELADDRLIRVGGPVDGKTVKLIHDPFSLKYELSLDDTERDPNIRHMYQENVMQIAPTLIRMNVFLPELLDYFALPVRVKRKLQQAMAAAAQKQQQDAKQGIQRGRGSPVTPEERQANIQKTQADTALQMARTEKTKAQEERDRIKVALEAVIKTAELKLEKERVALDSKLGRQTLAHDIISTLLEHHSRGEDRKTQLKVAAAKPAAAKSA